MEATNRPKVVGSVHRVFDRSVYIEFGSGVTQGLQIPGPRLVLIGGPTFSGPLSLRVRTDGPGEFEPNQVSTGTRCTLRAPATAAASGGTRVLTVGSALEVEFEVGQLEPTPEDIGPTTQLNSIQRESQIWQHAAEAVADLIESETKDGLGWLDFLDRATESSMTPGELDEVIEGCRQALDPGWETQPPEAVHDLLGRGPGATPSGDDVLAGVFLILLRTTTGDAHQRVRHAGETLVAVAERRTTSVSTALLAQATRGRAADPIVEAREALLDPQMDPAERREALSTIQTIGHTSGVDTLVGMLLAIVCIAPSASTSE